jgi:hypothetical protein
MVRWRRHGSHVLTTRRERRVTAIRIGECGIASGHMKLPVMALALLMAGVAAGVVVTSGAVPIPAELSNQTVFVLQLGGLQDFIERIDAILESVVDLLRTLGQLFGEGGGE